MELACCHTLLILLSPKLKPLRAEKGIASRQDLDEGLTTEVGNHHWPRKRAGMLMGIACQASRKGLDVVQC